MIFGDIFLVVGMLSNFGWYSKHFEYYVMRVWVILKHSIEYFFLFVLAGNQPDCVWTVSSVSPSGDGPNVSLIFKVFLMLCKSAPCMAPQRLFSGLYHSSVLKPLLCFIGSVLCMWDSMLSLGFVLVPTQNYGICFSSCLLYRISHILYDPMGLFPDSSGQKYGSF